MSKVGQKKLNLEFEVDDLVFRKTTSIKGTMRFGKNEMLNLKYIRHFEILRVEIPIKILDYKETISVPG